MGVDTYAASATTGDSTHFTRLDETIDFDVGRSPMLSVLIPTPVATYPTQYFSVHWRGFLKAPSSSLYRLHIESYEAAFYELDISGQTRISGEFPTESDVSLSS